ncbi:methionyl-tRNA formyltransferase [Croceitalea sp. MTPC5]|nr:methionyl-tRNA formyltransferase [Croceitalea sp. MTPC5]
MGTPEFAVAGLDKLVTSGYHIVGVITAPDRPAGRGRKVQQSAVKKYALDNELNLLQPTNLKDPGFIAALEDLKANLQIVVAFRMLPKVVWQMPKYGTFNLHASILPQYRGAAPINWAIINGETQTGATTFFIDEKIDTGEIIMQEKLEIAADETAGELHDRLMALGADLILKTVVRIEKDTVELQKQEENQNLKTAHKIYKETCQINWSRPLKTIYNHIRGLSPYPTAWSIMVNDGNEISVKIFKVGMEKENHTYTNGKIIADKKSIKVAVENGFINLLEIQLSGKRKMAAHEVLNGLSISEEAYMR